MYTSSLPLISFFLSLAGIILMIWRELILIRKGEVSKEKHSHHFIFNFEKIKEFAFRNTKKIGYLFLTGTIRFFVKSSNFIKNTTKTLVRKAKNKLKKEEDNILNEEHKKEVSKYLKIISEYRTKIKRLKNKIEKEEGIEQVDKLE